MFYSRAARAVAVLLFIMSLWSCRPLLTFPPAAEDASQVEARSLDTVAEAGRVEIPPDAKADDLARIDARDIGPELPQDLDADNVCQHQSAECYDGDYCNIDTCDVAALTCQYEADPAKPGCCNDVADCDDGDLCTEDLCVDHVCVYQ